MHVHMQQQCQEECTESRGTFSLVFLSESVHNVGWGLVYRGLKKEFHLAVTATETLRETRTAVRKEQP